MVNGHRDGALSYEVRNRGNQSPLADPFNHEWKV